MTTIHLIEGPVGAGKSTFAMRLARDRRAPWLDLDEWMVILFRPDRPATDLVPWYTERKQRCLEQIWRVTCELIGSGSDVVLELGLIQRQDREAFYHRVDDAGHHLIIYLLDTPEAVRRERVRARNRDRGEAFKMEVADEIFELANRMWEPPSESEDQERGIVHVPAC